MTKKNSKIKKMNFFFHFFKILVKKWKNEKKNSNFFFHFFRFHGKIPKMKIFGNKNSLNFEQSGWKKLNSS